MIYARDGCENTDRQYLEAILLLLLLEEHYGKRAAEKRDNSVMEVHVTERGSLKMTFSPSFKYTHPAEYVNI